MNTLRLCLLLISVAVGFVALPRAYAYEPAIHQQLTFIAARQFNRCAQNQPDLPRLSALDTRYIVKALVAQADTNVFVRMFRWDYYNRADQQNRSAWWVIDTRFHKRFDELAAQVETNKRKKKRLRDAGRLMNYVQNVTSPAHAVPVYHGRWWRFSMEDKFNRFPIDADRVEAMVSERCDFVQTELPSYQQILIDTATATAAAVKTPIYGFPTTWESYWSFARRAEDFGEYGPAGNNFGERTEFDCGTEERCLLLDNDPLYEEFAVQRHVSAVLATMRVIARLQMQNAL